MRTGDFSSVNRVSLSASPSARMLIAPMLSVPEAVFALMESLAPVARFASKKMLAPSCEVKFPIAILPVALLTRFNVPPYKDRLSVALKLDSESSVNVPL